MIIMALNWAFARLPGLVGGPRDDLWSQLPRWAPQGAGHPPGRVPAQLGRDVGVALGLADLGVTEDLLDDADADALLQ
jgi:hypothetical protein